MSVEPVAYRCGLYLPGHDVHWIQARVARKDGTGCPEFHGHLLGTRPGGVAIIEAGGVVHRLWNHNADRLERLAAVNDGAVSYQPGFGLVRTASNGGSYLFCVIDADSPDLRPCPDSPPTGTMVELLRNAGGFSIPGREALGLDDSEEGS